MTTAASIIALAAQGLPDGDAPDWVHLLPAAKGAVRTHDGRGPYRIENPEAIIQASMADPRGMLIDENHATDTIAKQGGSAPAHGWIAELQVRADGIWGRVDWNASGKALLAERAYRGLSPVIVHNRAGAIERIVRASLTNVPNLVGLTSLNTENAGMSWEKIAKAVGLGAEASEDDILGAITKLQGAKPDTALQSALGEIGTALGVEGADTAAIVAAAKAAKGDGTVTALQAELREVGQKLVALQTETARAKATAFVDGAIARGCVGVKPLRDHYIARHMADATAVEKEIAAMPVLAPGALPQPAPAADADGKIVALNAEQRAVAAALGVAEADYLKTLNAEKGIPA